MARYGASTHSSEACTRKAKEGEAVGINGSDPDVDEIRLRRHKLEMTGSVERDGLPVAPSPKRISPLTVAIPLQAMARTVAPTVCPRITGVLGILKIP